jgi:Protein of unknown function (DUF429)
MGREYRLSRDPRLRQESRRRPARVSPALSGGIVRFTPSRRPVTLVGIDVGEDYLDLALVNSWRHSLELRRVALLGIEVSPGGIAGLSIRLAEALSSCQTPTIALIDSPRWPLDLDCRKSSLSPRFDDCASGRRIDARLRDFTKHLAATGEADFRLSLFPTPRLNYFRSCVQAPACKPHLSAIGRDLFGRNDSPSTECGPRGGALFTRFMLAGFAAYQALEAIGVTTFEAYPDLQFRLWRDGRPLAPKSRGKSALADRFAINFDIAVAAGIRGADQIRTLDQADAAILALTAYSALDDGAVGIFEEPEEGCFAASLQYQQAVSVGLLTREALIAVLTGAQAGN